MFQLLVLCFLYVSSVDSQNGTAEEQFSIFLMKYNKHYNEFDRIKRFNIWQQKSNMIKDNNRLYHSGKVTYFLKEYNYTDWTDEEFRKYKTGAVPPRQDRSSTTTTQSNQGTILLSATRCSYSSYSSKDYRTQGAVSPVKDQGNCGSCWAFSAVGALESAYFIKTLTMQQFSEQQLVDCSSSYGNNGCTGGWMDNAFNYMMANGINNSSCYLYTAQKGNCSSSNCVPATYVTSYVDVTVLDECLMMQALNNHGPQTIALCGSHPSFQLYGGGYYTDKACNCTVDHAVLIVGWTIASGSKYWILKNSWGTNWGDNGFMYMAMGSNLCSLSYCSYPLV